MLTKEEEAWWKNLKKGDYIVCTDGDSSMIPSNYIFKTNHGNIEIYGLVTDLNGNANGYVGINEKIFRPATPEEIKMYEHAGKPVDVSTYKIPEVNLIKDKIAGEYYYSKFRYDSQWGEIIVKWGKISEKNQFISLHNKCYKQESCCTAHTDTTIGEIFRLATPEEKQWLNVCIAENKFIEKDYALGGYDMYGRALKSEVIPEYVEATQNLTGIIKGKIYPYVRDIVIDGKFNNYQDVLTEDDKYFKLSTKEAYEAQQEFVLPEKWCIKASTDYSISKWFTKHSQTGCSYTSSVGYLHYPSVGGGHAYPKINSDYTEITFEQFKKYVLKEEAPVKPEVVESKSEEKIMKAIIIENKEQWNFALNRIRKGKNFYEKPNSYATECMNSISGEFSNIKYYKERGDEVITFDQWCKEEGIDNPFTKKMKDEFVVGKWYKCNNKSYICKLEEVKRGNEMWSTEWISNGGYSKDKYKTWMRASIVDEAPLSEIQQYLPDGHVDKVMKEEFKVGDWVVIKNTGFAIDAIASIGEVVRISSFDKIGGYDWCVQFDGGGKGGYYKNYPITDYIRKATPEEIAKVIGKTKYFDDLSQHIGRYIKALVDYPNGGVVKKGEIGKILDEEHADFPSQSNYICDGALTEFNKDRYELLPESYSPEVKSDNMEDLLEEAKKRFPVGTRFKVAHNSSTAEVVSHNKYENTFVNNGRLHINLLSKIIENEEDAIATKGASVYYNGEWAEIISSPKESVKEEKTTNHQFKIGDEVFLPQYGLGMLNDGSKENKDWALTDGIPLNTKLIVRNVSVNSNIRFLGYKYNHPASKFKPISELNKQAVYDPGEWGWKVSDFDREIMGVGLNLSYPLTPDEVVKQDVIPPILFKVKEI